MERKKTYQELLKEYTMTQNQKEAKALEWYTEIFLNDLLQKRREEQLRAEIDLALDQRDEEAFMKLSKELISHMDK
ncbi:IDEAL domain-containing protein [Siminovitchia fortis]|uniref:IDEAL domain-containing protein n=1 Tax=Siminovitchia fortis TaxID=254758 RepID=A0A443J2L8_9BACI|nr:IDEAL domain-containing protein [Siminovitchia fortis]RWR14566.1 IDEAL domain-containing protein [Siminovitchia fortis]WHY80248.1 IDEAL domain-containing protein [Siminovitchia fortis]